MATSPIVTRGYGQSIPLVVLRGFLVGPEATPEETDSAAGLRYYARTLEMPGIIAGSGRALFTEIAAVVGVVAELGETVTVSGESMSAVVVTPFEGALMAGTEIGGRRTVLYVAASDFDDADGALGDACTVRSVSYTIGRVERYDAPLVRLELVR